MCGMVMMCGVCDGRWCVVCVMGMVDDGDIDLGEEMRIGSWCGASVTLRPSLKTKMFYNFDNKSIVFIYFPSRTKGSLGENIVHVNLI